LRHQDANGKTYFSVVRAGKLYDQIVVIGNATRVTEDPGALFNKGDAAMIAAGVPGNSRLLANPTPVQAMAASYAISPQTPVLEQSMPSTLVSGSTLVSRYLSTASTSAFLKGDVLLEGIELNMSDDNDLLSDSSYGLAHRLQQSYVLGSPGEQPLVSGFETFSQDSFEYWVDTLSL
jgi:hypothetical protein